MNMSFTDFVLFAALQLETIMKSPVTVKGRDSNQEHFINSANTFSGSTIGALQIKYQNNSVL